MGLASLIKAVAGLIDLINEAVEAYQRHKERERGRLELMLELRQQRDQEKAKANEIDSRPVPPDDSSVIGGL